MAKYHRTWAVLAVVAMLCLTAVLMAQNTPKAARPTRVAVVDVRKVFNSLDERVKMEADLTVMDQQTLEERKKKADEIQTIQADLNLIGPNGPGYEAMQAKYEMAQIQLGAWMKYQEARRAREARLRTLDLYRKITKTVEDTAKEMGYDLVLYTDDINMDEIKAEEVAMMISSRRVLYAAADLDITDTIRTRMNNAFKNNMPR